MRPETLAPAPTASQVQTVGGMPEEEGVMLASLQETEGNRARRHSWEKEGESHGRGVQSQRGDQGGRQTYRQVGTQGKEGARLREIRESRDLPTQRKESVKSLG